MATEYRGERVAGRPLISMKVDDGAIEQASQRRASAMSGSVRGNSLQSREGLLDFVTNGDRMHRTFAIGPAGLIFVLLFAALCATAAEKDSITIGGVTFDFGAPSAPLTASQQAFFQKYKDAVNRRDENALLALQDPVRSSCKFDGDQILLRELRHVIPDQATVRFFPSNTDFAKVFGFGDMAYLSVAPTAVLGISYRSATKERVSITQIMRPVRQSGESITLVPYCLTEKGKNLLEQRKQ